MWFTHNTVPQSYWITQIHILRAITGLQISAMDENTRGWFRYEGMFGQANFKLDIITKIVLISYDMH